MEGAERPEMVLSAIAEAGARVPAGLVIQVCRECSRLRRCLTALEQRGGERRAVALWRSRWGSSRG